MAGGAGGGAAETAAPRGGAGARCEVRGRSGPAPRLLARERAPGPGVRPPRVVSGPPAQPAAVGSRHRRGPTLALAPSVTPHPTYSSTLDTRQGLERGWEGPRLLVEARKQRLKELTSYKASK
ncbi:arf-GAP with GTPase, ANK repeat and PH domain-containing protein 2-like [Zalophus californianus]|uniref:Arf-GAP with GTPase, ANK repeat and PH domain-containing protein 2-like n=1 Tax=Zalophus californianus TaxID=9704 RepID=A0A6J2DS17_ZALCA|nr:arf-GAP with GTPase, ANK repeat and PH domain-containing protein 2-like [Zalophus californianus]XP_027458581.1 arf-GAP with GTPase, ANK repeat and PH domain-containing protein 2-like [Zalophus californianus]